jgi:glycosyltransferase involved in cell wall biosynthesis
VRITGWLAHEELPAFYSLADAFVFPSLYEGFGIPLLEAMACGCPVVCSDRASLPELVGDAALLADPDDERAVGEALRAALNPVRASELRRRGLARAAEFTWARCAAATVAAYRSAAGA